MATLILVAAVVGVCAGGFIFYAGVRLGARLQWSSQDGSEPFKKPLKPAPDTTD